LGSKNGVKSVISGTGGAVGTPKCRKVHNWEIRRIPGEYTERWRDTPVGGIHDYEAKIGIP
jgi:hypothetical protein